MEVIMRNTLIILILTGLTSGITHAKEVRIASINQPTPRLAVSQNIMSQIYQRLGHSITLVNFPPKRSLIEANNGAVNGELARSSLVAERYPNLIHIPYAIGTIKLVTLQTKNNPPIQQLADLKEYRIGVLRGYALAEKMSKHLTREIYNDLEGLFKALIHGRVDVVLFSKLGAEHFIRKFKLEDKLVISEKSFMEIPLYHYLHNNSANIAQALAAEMQKMQTTGELQDLINTEEQSFLNTSKQ